MSTFCEFISLDYSGAESEFNSKVYQVTRKWQSVLVFNSAL